MPTIRDLVEGRDLQFASPLAKHVGSHIADPIGATKPMFDKLSKSRMDYDQAREEARRNIAPVQSVIDHVSQLHNLQPGNGTPGMGLLGEDNEEQQQVDEFGNVIPPGQQGQQQQGVVPPGQLAQPGGNLNVNRPSQVGHQPGVAPMNEKQVVPKKLGLASPGGPAARNSPMPKGSNPQAAQFNPTAKPPQGNRTLPGAKGPGDAKVANRTKKAQQSSPGLGNSTNRPIKIQVHASSQSYPEVTTVHDYRSLEELRAQGSMPIGPGGALGPSGVMPSANPATGDSVKTKRTAIQSARVGTHRFPGTKFMKAEKVGTHRFPGTKKVKALEELSDKEPADTQHQVAYNPVIRSARKINLDLCAKCGKMHAEGAACPTSMKSAGHSRGAKKGWATRGKGHLSSQEKQAHYGEMDKHMLLAAFNKDRARGWKPKMKFKAPPGWEGTVKHMKKHGDIDNPWALAWYMKNKGYSSHKAMEAFAL